MVSIVSLVLFVSCDLFCFIVTCLCLVYNYATLVVVSYCCWFCMVFFLFASQSCFYCFENLWNWLGKGKVNGAHGELNETSQVM